MKIMPQARTEEKICREPQNKHKLASFSESNGRKHIAAESRKKISEKKTKKERFAFVKFKGLGCKGTSSTPAIIRSAAEWETKRAKDQNQTKKKPSKNRRNPANIVVDFVPDVCCAPPGIGLSSDFAPLNKNPASKLDHRKHPREPRRNGDDSSLEFPAISQRVISSRTNNHRSAGEIIEMMMSQQTLLPGRIVQGNDRYWAWRRNIDDMSYEELLDLGDKIGYVGTGLQEEEISRCIRKFKMCNQKLITSHKDWKCSICQEKGRRNDDIGTLDCGHHHHLQCIKKWLTHKNECPVCKSAVMLDKSR
ncbi:hypothetical protein ABFX02_05G036000 [Erythranthe guttata]